MAGTQSFDYQRIIDKYYPEGTPLRDIYMRHAESVANLALELARKYHLPLDGEEVRAAAMLHDIGIYMTDAPGIYCHGTAPYLQHGPLGAELLRREGAPEIYARVAERHTGAGIEPYLPETLLEKLICYADKFYSKSGDMERKPLQRVEQAMYRYGWQSLARFAALRHAIIGLLLLLGVVLPAGAVTPGEIAARLDSLTDYSAMVRYAISLPQADDDAKYQIELSQPGSDGSFLIDWQADTPGGPAAGWAARFEDHFYAYRGGRLREFHADWDDPATMRAANAQFAELLPGEIAGQIRNMLAHPEDFELRADSTAESVTLSGRRYARGELDAEFQWQFDRKSCRPMAYMAEYNPESVAFQQVQAKYFPMERAAEVLDEELLRQRYPDAFANARESNYAIETLRGHRLPSGSLALANGTGRMEFGPQAHYDRPTLLIMLNAGSELAPELVGQVRRAAEMAPVAPTIIWAVAERAPDDALALIGTPSEGEVTLTGAKGYAAKCGAAALPVIIALNSNGTVADLQIGLNKETAANVIRMITAYK